MQESKKLASHHRLGRNCISVILPARDAANTLGKAVKSILRQWGSHLRELLVIIEENDVATQKALDGLEDPRLRLVLIQPNASLTAKLNLGIKHSEGPLIARMDADDIALPWRFLRQVRILQKYRADLLFSTALVFGRDLWPIPLLPQLPITLHSTDIYHSLLAGNLLVHPTMLASRSIVQMVGGYRQVPAEDLDLWLRLSIKEANMLRDWMPTVLYRFAKTSMSHTESHRISVSRDQGITELRGQLALTLNQDSNVSESRRKPANRTSWRLGVASMSFGRNQ